MMTPLWTLLESRSRLVAVRTEWEQRLGPAFKVILPLLRPTDEMATAYPNPQPGGASLRVVRHRVGDVVAVGEDGEGVRVALTEGDVVLFELNLPKLRKQLAAALGLKTARTSMNATSSVIRMGTWEPQPAVGFAVLLCRAPSIESLASEVQRAACEVDAPLIVLTPTRRLWRDGLADWCSDQRAALVPLDEVIEYCVSALVATPAWQSHLNAFCDRAKVRFPSNVTNKRARRKRADRAEKIEAIRKQIVKIIEDARDHAFAAVDSAREPELLRCPTKTVLASLADLKPHDVTRCFKDDPQLPQLWQIAHSLEDVMRFGKPRSSRRRR